MVSFPEEGGSKTTLCDNPVLHDLVGEKWDRKQKM